MAFGKLSEDQTEESWKDKREKSVPSGVMTGASVYKGSLGLQTEAMFQLNPAGFWEIKQKQCDKRRKQRNAHCFSCASKAFGRSD